MAESNPITQIYLSSIWAYRPAGAGRIIKALDECKFTSSTFNYEKHSHLFRVVCCEKDIPAIMDQFIAVNKDMEWQLQARDVVNKDGTLNRDVDNEWFEGPRNDFCADAADSDPDEHDLPPFLKDFKAKAIWRRLENESIKAENLLPANVRGKLEAATGVKLSWDLTRTLVFIGGDSEQTVADVKRKLQVLLDYSKVQLPRSRHIFYAEGAERFHVDAREMSWINEEIHKSTILDPGEYRLPAKYDKLRRDAVGLRACLPEGDKFLSTFGPRAKAVFEEARKRRWFEPFAGFAYPPKTASAPATIETTSEPQGAVTQRKRVEKWIDQVTDDTSISNKSVPSSSGERDTTVTTDTHEHEISPPALSPVPDERAVLEESKAAMTVKSDIHSPGDKSHDDGPSEVASNTDARSGIAVQPGQSIVSMPLESTMALLNLSEPLDVTPALAPAKENPQAASLLQSYGICFDDEINSREFHQTMGKQASSYAVSEANKNHTVTRHNEESLDFAAELDIAMNHLVEPMRASNGLLSMRVEFGRIYLSGVASSGLARNAPGTPSNGWDPTTLAQLLEGSGTTDKLSFTKILSIFGPDAEFLGDVHDENSGTRLWKPKERRIVYEFRCKSKSPEGTHEFIVDVNGSSPGGFNFRIRTKEDDFQPIWVHCLQRHWDIRIVLSLNHTDALQTIYGQFARLLVQSLVIIPSKTGGLPGLFWYEDCRSTTSVEGVRVRHTARYISNDSRSNLDITQVRELGVEMTTQKCPPGKRKCRTLNNINDDLKNGKFSTWYEASISSVTGEQLFRQNQNLVLGDLAQWTPKMLKEQKVFSSMYEPALKMIKLMDGVGVYCDNGQSGKSHSTTQTATGSASKQAAREKSPGQKGETHAQRQARIHLESRKKERATTKAYW